MPRFYKRKSEAGQIPSDVMKVAANEVLEGKSVREVAENYGMSKSTLHRYVGKLKTDPNAEMQPNYKHKQIFTTAQEKELVNYLLTCSNMFYGLTTKQVKALAYEMAQENKIQVPESWHEKKEAGKEWLYHFMQRNREMSLRMPEATSLARASAFNRPNIAAFFKLLNETVTKTKATAFSIFNLDESGCTTVQSVPKVIAPRGQKQVGQITSQERGELVTICGIVSASGSSVPPVLIFPRKNMKDYMMIGAPEGSLGLASGNGWMNSDLFPKVLEHFVSFVRPTEEKQVVLILDNHHSHLSFPALEFAKKNFIHILTLPPHTSNKTQPLDRTVFGPFKSYFNVAANSLMLQHPGKNITIYNMAALINEAWLKAATPQNITSGFRASGIWPLNEFVFEDTDYLPAAVTDQPQREHSDEVINEPIQGPSGQCEEGQSTSGAEQGGGSPSDSPSAETTRASGSGCGASFTSPVLFRGFPKAPERKESSRGRKKGRSMLATSSPEMRRIELGMAEKRTKEMSKLAVKSKARRLFDNDTDSDQDIDISDVIGNCSTSESHDSDHDVDGHEIETLVLGSVDNPQIGDFVLCEYQMKTKVIYYIGTVKKERDTDDELEMEFLKRMNKNENKFVFKTVEDIATIHIDQLKAILPPPVCTGTTSRTKGIMVFNVTFGNIDLR